MSQTQPESPLRAIALTLFSCGTLNATGAVLQSYSLGAPLGAVGFALIGALGLYGKYQVLRGHAPSDNRLIRAATCPTLTMSALASVSMTTGLQLLYSTVTSPSPNPLMGARAAGWFFGVLGDIAQRETDHINYKRDDTANAPRPVSIFNKLTRCGAGPYYNLVSLSFTLAVGMNGAPSATQLALTGVAASCFAVGAVTAFAPAASRLNKAGHFLGAAGTVLLSGLSFMVGAPLTGVAQILFATSYLAIHAEHRRANRKIRLSAHQA